MLFVATGYAAPDKLTDHRATYDKFTKKIEDQYKAVLQTAQSMYGKSLEKAVEEAAADAHPKAFGVAGTLVASEEDGDAPEADDKRNRVCAT